MTSDLYIKTNAVQQRLNNVLKYIEENPYSDPNAYEMCELTFDVADISHEACKNGGYNALNNEIISKLRNDYAKMMDMRLEQLVIPDIGLCESKKDKLYCFFDKSRQITDGALGNDKAKQVYSKACGINLFVKQRLREMDMTGKEEVIYDNRQELNELEQMLKNDKKAVEIYSFPILDIEELLSDAKLALGKTPEEYKQAKKLAQKEEKSKGTQDIDLY